MKRSKPLKIILTSRDIDILMKIWKWKFLSTGAVHKSFFRHTSKDVCYLRLNKLKKAKYLDLVYIALLGGFCWTLTSKSFEVIKYKLPDLKSFGYKSEHKHHDQWVNFCHLGPFLSQNFKEYVLVSEQQLRHFDESCFPDWLPKTELHRPDGYWMFKDESQRRLTSLEVELSQKSMQKFEETLTFYRHHQEIDSVIWVSDNNAFLKRIKNKVMLSVDQSSQTHYFFRLRDMVKMSWSAKSCFSENKGLCFGELILNEGYTEPIQELSFSSTKSISDLRKKPS